jgi:hypothetical protein
VVLRCTVRLLKVLGAGHTLVDDPPCVDDWYANVVWIERRKCLQLMHAETLFPVVLVDVRVGDLRPIGRLVTTAIHDALADEQLPADALGALDADAVRLARTSSRQVRGYMTDDAKLCQHAARVRGGIDRLDLDALNRRLRRTLHNLNGKYVTPLDLVHRRLAAQP